MTRIFKILKTPEIWIFLFFIAISVLFYPAILHPSSTISGAGGGDDFGGIYSIWWQEYSTTNNLDQNNFSLINFPDGRNAQNNVYYIWNHIISFLNIFVNEIAVYNIINWISFPLSAIGMYLLVLYITKNRWASVISALIFSFSPYHFIRVTGHTTLANIEWFPFFALSILKLVETKKYRYAVFSGIFFALNFFTDYYYGLFLSIFLIIFLSVRLFVIKSHITKQKLKLAAVFCLTVFILIGSYLTPIILSQKKEANSGMLSFSRPVEDLARWGQQSIKYLLVPSQDNYLFGDFYNKIFYHGQGIPDFEYLAYLSIPAILLAIYAIYKWRKEKTENQQLDFIMILFIVTAITATIFSFSPPISPSHWIYKILPQFRVYSRLFVLVSLSIAVLAGVGLKYLFEYFKTSKLLKYIPIKRLIIHAFTIIFIIIILDLLPSFKTTDVSQPPAEYIWLKNQPRNTVIAEYPYVNTNYSPTPTYLFWQRYHHQPMINGQPEPDTTGKEQIRLQIYDITNPNSVTTLKKLGANYVFVHKDQYNKPFWRGTEIPPEKILSRSINPKNINPNLELIQRFGQTYIYKIK